MTESCPALKKIEFGLHHARLTDTHRALLDNSGKVAGCVLRALGWLATSESARTLLTPTPSVATVGALAVFIAWAPSAIASRAGDRACNAAMARVHELQFMPGAADAS